MGRVITGMGPYLLQSVEAVLHEVVSPHSHREGAGDSTGPVPRDLCGVVKLRHLVAKPGEGGGG